MSPVAGAVIESYAAEVIQVSSVFCYVCGYDAASKRLVAGRTPGSTRVCDSSGLTVTSLHNKLETNS